MFNQVRDVFRGPPFTVVGEAGTARISLEVMEREKPDIVIRNISLPDSSGIELAKQLKKQFPETHVIMVSMHTQQEYILAAFAAGASGYVTKEATAGRLLEALRVVEDGEMFIDHVCTKEIIERLLRAEGKGLETPVHRYGELTEREQEILTLAAKDLSTREISDRLMISEKTASNHRSHLMQKLGFTNAVELVRYAEKIGLIDS